MFPKNVLSSQKFHIMNNAVKVERFKFSEEIRHKKRVELDLENRIIIGQVGAFSYQKNSEFVVDKAEALHRKNSKTMVLMIGTGSDFDEINKRVKERKLENAVRLMGSRKDVNELMQAMDIFILPSRFEGLPIVAIEAQVSSLGIALSKVLHLHHFHIRYFCHFQILLYVYIVTCEYGISQTMNTDTLHMYL